MTKINGNFPTCVDIFEHGFKTYTNNRLYGVKNKAGEYEWVTYKYIGDRADNLRAGLASLGIKKNDAVGGIFNNRPEYAVTCIATMGLGAWWIPMYLKEMPQIWKYIINDVPVKVLIVNDEAVYDQIMAMKSEMPKLEHIIIIESQKENSLANLEKKGAEKPVPVNKPTPKDIACMIYTSGTTGDPKGVLLSHSNLTSNVQGAFNGYHTQLDTSTVSFNILPWAHSYGFVAEFLNWYQFGGSTGFMESSEKLVEDLPKVAPTVMIAVPRIFNKVYDGIHHKMKAAGGAKLALFNAAKAAAKAKRETGKAGFKFKLLDKLVFKKVRALFGGRLLMSVTSSAVMNIDVGNFFYDLGIPCYDCYGMTELSPAATMNSPDAGWKLGSVGKAIEKVTIKIDKERCGADSKDGEIVVYGPNVMQGYHNKPDKTKEVMTPDGGIRTGDRGWMDNEGYVYITGRFKEEYKLENGKYIHPASIEGESKLLPYIANTLVFGDGKPFNVALVVLDFTALANYAADIGLSPCPKNYAEFMADENAVKLVTKALNDHLGKSFLGSEVPRKYAFIKDDFTVENGMLTQTLKLKRRIVLENYKKQLDELYK
jgi:long-chain acyl-CoA synthetase